jgi:Na+/H+ antiporter NhaC
MEAVIKKANSFLAGLLSIMMAILPVTILWTVLTGGSVFGMDVVANLTALVTSLGQGGFVGLVVLVIVWGFFIKK